MKVKRVSEHIWSIKTWMGFPIHVWLVANENKLTLVDAGMSMMAKEILKAIDRLDIGPLESILLTHGHKDHVGALKSILDKTEVPVYAHEIEIPYMEGVQLYPRRKKLERNVPANLILPLQTNEAGNLETISGLTPYYTPGHSPGHVVYYHEHDNILIAGDLFTSRKGKLQKPMKIFTGDMEEAVESSAIVKELKPKQLLVCHGEPVHNPADQLEAYVNQMNTELSKA